MELYLCLLNMRRELDIVVMKTWRCKYSDVSWLSQANESQTKF